MHATDDTYQETLPSAQGRRRSGASINKLSPKLLLCDDEPAILRVVCAALHRVGVECITAPSGQRGIELASDPTLDLLLLDLRLGDMDAIAVLKELHRTGRHLPFANHHRVRHSPVNGRGDEDGCARCYREAIHCGRDRRKNPTASQSDVCSEAAP